MTAKFSGTMQDLGFEKVNGYRRQEGPLSPLKWYNFCKVTRPSLAEKRKVQDEYTIRLKRRQL